MAKHATCLILLLLIPLSAPGQNDEVALNLVSRAMELNLDRHRTWLKLGHYEKGLPLISQLESAIKSESFFLASNGRHDPTSELQATLRAFTEAVGEDPNSHAQCLFRGRYVWLNSQLALESSGVLPVTCPEYDSWSLNGTTHSISLVFATGYLGNPASYYGHTLIKMNSSTTTDRTPLEDISINYGAIVPPNEGSIPYILKGLFGGYSGGFSHTQFYFHDHNYGETQLRDLWEYELNLTQEEVDLVLGHSWEVLGKEYTYYFLNENCAYQMARVLEVVDGVDLLPAVSIWNMPQSLIRSLNETRLRDRPLVGRVDYLPSRQSRLYTKFNQLDSEQQNLVREMILNPRLIDSPLLGSLSHSQQLRTLDTLIDYYDFVRDDDALSGDPNNARYNRVLSTRFSLPPGQSDFAESIPGAPHEGRNPSLVQVSAINNQYFGRGSMLTLRPAYYDPLDADPAHIGHAELKMGEITLKMFESSAILHRIEVFSVQSVPASHTGLPGDSSNTWRLGFRVQQQSLACRDCLVSRIDADYGYSFSPTESLVLGVLAGAAAHDNRNGIGNISGKGTVFADLSLGRLFTARLEAVESVYIDSSADSETDFKLEARYETGQNSAMRLSFNKDEVREVALTFDYYF